MFVIVEIDEVTNAYNHICSGDNLNTMFEVLRCMLGDYHLTGDLEYNKGSERKYLYIHEVIEVGHDRHREIKNVFCLRYAWNFNPGVNRYEMLKMMYNEGLSDYEEIEE